MQTSEWGTRISLSGLRASKPSGSGLPTRTWRTSSTRVSTARLPVPFRSTIASPTFECVTQTKSDSIENTLATFLSASLARGPSALLQPIQHQTPPQRAATAGPGFVPLSQLATIETLRSPNELWRENQQPVITVTSEIGDRDLGSISRDVQAKLAEMTFPGGYRWELAGNFRSQKESFASLINVIIVSAVLVFLMLSIQFKSLLLPLLIFLSQPLSLTSALLALWVTGTPLNVASFMGAILLIGLDVKNGILLVEYIGQFAPRVNHCTRHSCMPAARGFARF